MTRFLITAVFTDLSGDDDRCCGMRLTGVVVTLTGVYPD